MILKKNNFNSNEKFKDTCVKCKEGHYNTICPTCLIGKRLSEIEIKLGGNMQQSPEQKFFSKVDQAKKTVKKDRIFIFVLAIVTAGLFYQTASLVVYIFQNHIWLNFLYWAILIGNILAVYSIMYLINNYRKRIKIATRDNEEMILSVTDSYKSLDDSQKSERELAIDLLKELGLM